MKKLFLFLMALFTLTTVHADLILHESFDRNVGDLNKGDFTTIGNNTTDWFWFLTGSTDIKVVDGSLAYPNYVTTGIGRKAFMQGGSGKYKDLRQFKSINTGRVYVAAIINVETLKTATTADYFLALGDMTASNMYARIYTSSVKEGEEWIGFKLGIQKNNENSNARGYSETIYSPNTDYLIVAEYEFVDGAQNDTVRLYVNPTKDKKVPVAQCGQVYMIGDNNKGAGAQPDAAYLSSVNLRPSTATPSAMYVDEIKVATAWEDLFDEDTPVAEPAEITVTPSSLGSLQGFVGETYTKTFTVTGKNLTEDITLTSNSDEVTLDKTTISKDEATNATVTMTIAPQATGYGSYVVTLTSGEAKATVSYTYYNLLVNSAATIAELNAFAATASGWDYVYVKFTGEAVVTYKFNQSGNKLYLQDASGAVLISDSYWGDAVKQGDKVSNFTVFADATNSIGGLMYIGTEGANIDVLSHDNEVTPKVVTLAELQANPSDYLCQLVKVENVTFANTDVFASGDQVLQGDATATINLLAGNDLIGTAKVAPANVTGISSATNGKVLRVRGKQDVEKYVPSAIDNAVAEGEIEIYTVSGMRVAELQSGVNIIRQGGKTYKVVR
ncbi:MAG: hypothetical protein SOY26_00520 [Paludibacteraceae bacterium]|nr:hypothetical protein [Paludibacteraceae bacterium]